MSLQLKRPSIPITMHNYGETGKPKVNSEREGRQMNDKVRGWGARLLARTNNMCCV